MEMKNNYKKIPREIVKEIIDYLNRNKTLQMFFRMDMRKFMVKTLKEKYKEGPIYYSKKQVDRLEILRRTLVKLSYTNMKNRNKWTDIACRNSFERYIVYRFCDVYSLKSEVIETNKYTNKYICPLCNSYTTMYKSAIYCKNKKCNFEIYLMNDDNDEINNNEPYPNSIKKVDYIWQIRSLLKRPILKIIRVY